LREKLIQRALSDAQSPLRGVSAQDIVLDGGKLYAKSDHAKGETFQALLDRSGQPYLEAKGGAKPGAEKESDSMYAFGAQSAQVRVDADLGQVKVLHMVGCFGSGKILNSKTARSQFMGGIVWGISMALYEEAVTDKPLGR
jgi:xanthine dehydrogenase YagR molybdenum-binding subunit